MENKQISYLNFIGSSIFALSIFSLTGYQTATKSMPELASKGKCYCCMIWGIYF